MNGRTEVGLPALLAGVTVLLAALSPLLLPAEVVILYPLEGPAVTAPTGLVSAVAIAVAGGGVLLARRWAQLTRSRHPAGTMLGSAHALSWAGLALLAWPVLPGDMTWATNQLSMWSWVVGAWTGWVATRHRPEAVPAPVEPAPFPGEAVAWTGHARLSVDTAAPLVVALLLLTGPATATTVHDPGTGSLGVFIPLLFVLLLYSGQLRALWVTVTIGGNGVRVRTGPFGRVIHRGWDQIGAVEVLDEELSSDSLLWARRFERRYVLRPGPALRLRQPEPHLPAITVSVDHADQGAAVAARHLADRARRD
ncbi:MAG: hypothetical protein R6V28_01435 [Nitriliruptoraceae bacterium]